MTGQRKGASRAPRLDAGAVVAVGRRQEARSHASCSEADASVELSVSVTTRPQRPAKWMGATIISSRGLASMRWCDNGELLEWAEVFGNRYGTPRASGGGGAGRAAMTCCSTSTGRARSSSATRWQRILSASSCCRHPSPSWSGGLTTRAQDSDEVIVGVWPRRRTK